MIRNPNILKFFSWLFIWIMFITLFPPQVFALTGGPDQPEFGPMPQAGVSDMVDPSTGDFSRIVDLMEIGGYPISIVYNAGVTPDQQASSTGLGWTLHAGVIKVNRRGIPDDFKGEVIESEFNLKPNWTVGLNAGLDLEIFGKKLPKKAKISPTLGLFYNNYKGPGFEFSVAPSITAGNLLKSGVNANLGFSLNFNSASGNSFRPNISFSHANKKVKEETVEDKKAADTKFFKKLESPKNDKSSFSPNLSFTDPSYTPPIQFPMKTRSISGNVLFAAELFGSAPGMRFGGYFNSQSLKTKQLNKLAYGALYANEAYRSNSAIHDFNSEKDIPFSKDVLNLPLTQLTSDVYSLSGQGIGGAYQLKRGDVGIVYNNSSSNNVAGGSIGFEAGPGNLVRLGANFHANGGSSTTGPWSDDFPVFDKLDFKGQILNQLAFEPAYFKAANEASITPLNEGLYEKIGKEKAVAIALNDNTEVEPLNQYVSNLSISQEVKRDQREKRNQSITYLTAEEASQFGLIKKIEDYKLNTNMLSHPAPLIKDCE